MSLVNAMRARWTPENPALAWIGDWSESDLPIPKAWSYGELAKQIDQARGWLKQRALGPGDTLALQLPRHPALLTLALAALSEGMVLLPLNPAYTPRELRYALQDSGAKRAVLLKAGFEALREDPPCAMEQAGTLAMSLKYAPPATAPAPDWPESTPALLLYTSGTTGKPKGALSSHGNLQASIQSLHQAWAWQASDVQLHALPLFHVHGLVVAQLVALWAGARTLWLPKFNADEVWSAIPEHGVSVFMGVPTFHHRLLQSKVQADLSTMRLFTSGSAPLPAPVHAAFEQRTGLRILERYGMSEVGIVLSNPYSGERRAGTVGQPLPGVRAKVTDLESGEELGPDQIGEIRIAGPSVMLGYLGLPEQTQAAIGDGWMHTGDLGKLSADGYCSIVGSAGDLVISGGLHVYPREVETVLLEHPGVLEVAVVGVPHAEWGEQVVGLFVGEADPAQLLAWAREQLAGFKCPKELRVAAALPRNAMGKVQKSTIRADW
jgi:malonyl-CoA/methylmalonyl-CoA synthetase